MTEERLCGWHECAAPLVQRPEEADNEFRRRQTCGASCGSKLGSWRAAKARGGSKRGPYRRNHGATYSGPDWPRVTDEIDWQNAFAAHNVKARDGGYFVRPYVPDMHSYMGCAAAMLVKAEPSE